VRKRERERLSELARFFRELTEMNLKLLLGFGFLFFCLITPLNLSCLPSEGSVSESVSQ